MSTMPKEIYGISAISVKIPLTFCIETDKTTQKTT